MTRIPSHTVEDAPEASRELLADMVQFSPTGRLLNMHAQMAHAGAEIGEPRADALITVVREAAGRGGRVSDATWARALATGCTDDNLAEAFAYLGLTVFTAYFLNYADTELDVPASPELSIATGPGRD